MLWAQESVTLASNQGASANSAAQVVGGGTYLLQVEGTLGTAPKLQTQHPSGNWADYPATVTADVTVTLPPGAVRFKTDSDSSAVYAYLIRTGEP